MKSNPKIYPLFVIALGIVITFSALIIIDLNSNTGNKDKINGQDGNLRFSAVSGKIHIYYNSGWSNAKILNIYFEKFPVDIYSNIEDNSLKSFNSKYKRILKEEFLTE